MGDGAGRQSNTSAPCPARGAARAMGLELNSARLPPLGTTQAMLLTRASATNPSRARDSASGLRAATWRELRMTSSAMPLARDLAISAGCAAGQADWLGEAVACIYGQVVGTLWLCEPKALKACSKFFWRSHWSSIGTGGGFERGAWANAHASSRGTKSPSSSARFHSNPAGNCLAGLSAAFRLLPIAWAIGSVGSAPRLASQSRQGTCATPKRF